MQVTYFLNGPINLYVFCFFVILFYIDKKYKLPGKFQRFNNTNGSIEMLRIVEFSKISIKIKNFQKVCKAQTTNLFKKFIQSPRVPPPH